MSDYHPTRYRLSDVDRARYGGPEWVVFDQEKLFTMPASKLIKLEQEMNMSIGGFLAGRATGSVFGTKATLWLARRFAGIKEKFEDFDPHVFQVDTETVEPEGEPIKENPTQELSPGLEVPA